MIRPPPQAALPQLETAATRRAQSLEAAQAFYVEQRTAAAFSALRLELFVAANARLEGWR